jgi:hypothetical protein
MTESKKKPMLSPEATILLAAFAGLALIVFGAWLIYHPLGPIVAGVILLLGAGLAQYDRDRNARLRGDVQ